MTTSRTRPTDDSLSSASWRARDESESRSRRRRARRLRALGGRFHWRHIAPETSVVERPLRDEAPPRYYVPLSCVCPVTAPALPLRRRRSPPAPHTRESPPSSSQQQRRRRRETTRCELRARANRRTKRTDGWTRGKSTNRSVVAYRSRRGCSWRHTSYILHERSRPESQKPRSRRPVVTRRQTYATCPQLRIPSRSRRDAVRVRESVFFRRSARSGRRLRDGCTGAVSRRARRQLASGISLFNTGAEPVSPGAA